jgi:hypothetical protein
LRAATKGFLKSLGGENGWQEFFTEGFLIRNHLPGVISTKKTPLVGNHLAGLISTKNPFIGNCLVGQFDQKILW